VWENIIALRGTGRARRRKHGEETQAAAGYLSGRSSEAMLSIRELLTMQFEFFIVHGNRPFPI
jgi:hypothetical protein